MLLEEGIPAYSVYHLDSLLIDTSLLGFDLEKYGHIGFGMEVLRTERDSEDDTWEQPWGRTLCAQPLQRAAGGTHAAGISIQKIKYLFSCIR